MWYNADEISLELSQFYVYVVKLGSIIQTYANKTFFYQKERTCHCQWHDYSQIYQHEAHGPIGHIKDVHIFLLTQLTKKTQFNTINY